MTCRGKQKRFYPPFTDAKTGSSMLIGLFKFTEMEAQVFIPIPYISHLTFVAFVKALEHLFLVRYEFL